MRPGPMGPPKASKSHSSQSHATIVTTKAPIIINNLTEVNFTYITPKQNHTTNATYINHCYLLERNTTAQKVLLNFLYVIRNYLYLKKILKKFAECWRGIKYAFTTNNMYL